MAILAIMVQSVSTVDKQRTYIVTGVAGFIGSTLARQLLLLGHDVIGVDNLSLGKKSNVPDGVDFHEIDLSNQREMNQLPVTDVEAIFHLGGQSGGELSFSEPILDSNVRSTLCILEFAKLRGIKKLVHASSVAVYGEVNEGTGGIKESSQLNPRTPYGVSKLIAEKYLEIFAERNGVTSTSLRLFNVYGPGQDLARMNQGMLSIYLAQALRGPKITVKGALNRYRDFVDVRDATEAFLRSAQLTHVGHICLNVCSGQQTSVAQALEVLREEFSEEIRVLTESATPGDVHGWVGSTTRLEERLSWKPTRSFREGYKLMIRAEIANMKGR